jgi:transcriptional antiterminator NusG
MKPSGASLELGPRSAEPAEPAREEPAKEAPAEPPAVSEPRPSGSGGAGKAPKEKKAAATPGPSVAAKPSTNPAAPPAEAASDPSGKEEARPSPKRWYVVKVQSGREESIKEAIERKVRKEGLEEFYGQIVIPVEKITEVKTDRTGKRVTRTKERKLYPGYIMAEVEYNDRILYLFRETSGVGDFVGASHDRDKPPPPMTEREVMRMLGPQGHEDTPPVAARPRGIEVGTRVRVADGTFAGMEGEVREILEAVGHLRVELTIFGRPVPVELEYYQVEQA